MKYLPYLIILIASSSIYGQEIMLRGEVKGATGPIQLLAYENPFDQQINLLKELDLNSDGTFNYSFHSNDQKVILFKIDGGTVEILVRPGNELNLTFEVKKLPKPNWLGKTTELVLSKASSNDAFENMLFAIEKDLEKLKESFRKKNGSLSSKYSGELYEYWSNLFLTIDAASKSQTAISLVYSKSLNYLKKFGSPKNYELLEKVFLENITYTFEGLRSIKALYTNELLFEFLTKHIRKMNYFTFVDQSLKSIASEKLKTPLELSLIAISLERKWANPETAKNRLQQFIDKNEDPTLETLALSINTLYSADILGTEVQNFTFSTLENERFDLNSFRGKYLLIDFWATWCGPCVKSMKKLPQLKADFDNDLNILCISTSDNPDKVSKFINKNGYGKDLTFGLSTDIELIDSYFNINAIPLYFLVDPEGIIIDKAINDPVEMVKKYLR